MINIKLRLVPRFQRAIGCCQQTKIGRAYEDRPGQKLGVLGRIIAFIFSPPQKEFSCSALVAYGPPEKT